MKELPIEEKARRYDEAYKVAENIHIFSSDIAEIKRMEEIFPELKESEGEKIRKALINGFKDYKGWDEEWFDGITVREAIAWIEKQGEKPTAWSEEDALRLEEVICMIEANGRWVRSDDAVKLVLDWLKSLKDRVLPKQEWSALDERNLQGVIDEIQANKNNAPDYDLATYDRFLSWLKALRPKNRWKPSDEQMKALKEACDEHWEPDGLDPLYTLYQDLKKLKDE